VCFYHKHFALGAVDMPVNPFVSVGCAILSGWPGGCNLLKVDLEQIAREEQVLKKEKRK
jgi:hypothetical protein